MKYLVLVVTHIGALLGGVALGIYLLPILIAPDSPSLAAVQAVSAEAQFSGEFRRDLTDSDALHWGEGTVFLSRETIAFEGELAPGPDYRLYLSPEFVDTEAGFGALKSSMVQVAPINTFENFMVEVPADINPADYNAVIVWCETFGEFITAATYQ